MPSLSKPTGRKPTRARFRISTSVLTAALLLSPGTATTQESAFDCVIDPAQQVKIGSPIPGVLEQVQVRRGDFVKAGQPVALLESSIERATVEHDRVRAAATEEIDVQETRLTLYRGRLDRAEQLDRGGHVTKERLRELEAEVRIAERTVANERLKKRMAELELARSEAALERRIIRSPISGVVRERHLGPGEYTSQDAAILTLVELDPLHVETFVPVSYWGRIVEGTEGRVRLRQPIGGVHPATVVVVDRVFDAASGTFGIRLKLDNPSEKLPGGQRCTVSFALDGGRPNADKSSVSGHRQDSPSASGR
jgi:RND family efflux transporter MFP subunit